MLRPGFSPSLILISPIVYLFSLPAYWRPAGCLPLTETPGADRQSRKYRTRGRNSQAPGCNSSGVSQSPYRSAHRVPPSARGREGGRAERTVGGEAESLGGGREASERGAKQGWQEVQPEPRGAQGQGAGEAPGLRAGAARPGTGDWRLALPLVHSQVTAVRINVVCAPFKPQLCVVFIWSHCIHDELAQGGKPPPPGAT